MHAEYGESTQRHVIHVIETLGSGGAERLLHTNLRHLDPNRFRSSVVTVFSHGIHWKEAIHELGVPVSSLECSGNAGVPAATLRLTRLLGREKPELLHTHLWYANVIGRTAGRLAGVPVVSSVHNPDYEPEARDDGSGVSPTKRELLRLIDQWTARIGCARLVAVSDYVRRSAERRLRFAPHRIELLYNPLDLGELQAAPGRDRRQVRQALGLEPESQVLLHVGRLSPQKGLIYAIRALAELRAGFPKVCLVSAGAMDDRRWKEVVFEEVHALGLRDRVRFLGPRKDIPDLLRACDVFVFPSLHEGLGIALIEAMAAGCACVATTTGPLPEVVSSGQDGLLIPPADSRALIEALSQLLSRPELRHELGRSAMDAARARFAPAAAVRRLEDIYTSVLAERRRRHRDYNGGVRS